MDIESAIEDPREKKNNKKIILVTVIMVLTMGMITFYYWYQNNHFVITEDAQVDGDIVKVSPQITGKILEIYVEEDQYVQENGIIARQSDLTLASGANLDLTIIKAPVSGTIIKKIAHTGEIGTPGSPVIIMADLQDLYVTANIEEDKLLRVKEGQKVEYSIDSFPDINFGGRVISIGNAANSVFSLLPQQNTGNSFVKITQRIPVKISIDNYHEQCLLPGMNAVVKIYIK